LISTVRKSKMDPSMFSASNKKADANHSGMKTRVKRNISNRYDGNEREQE